MRGAKQFQKSRAINTKCSKALQRAERRSYAVTHGRVTVGTIEQTDKVFAAIAVSGATLGRYRSLTAAANAISEYVGGAR